MATITVPGMFLAGDHASLPAANTVGVGSLYACSTHTKVYQSDGSSWTDWFAPGAGLGAWTAYTPTLTATTTNPVLGSSTITGRYKQLDAKTYIVIADLAVTTGGAWSAGSGEWKFSLPSGLTSGSARQTMSMVILDAGVGFFAGSAKVSPSGTVIHPMVTADDTGNRVVSHNKPVTWATGDQITVSGVIEVA